MRLDGQDRYANERPGAVLVGRRLQKRKCVRSGGPKSMRKTSLLAARFDGYGRVLAQTVSVAVLGVSLSATAIAQEDGFKTVAPDAEGSLTAEGEALHSAPTSPAGPWGYDGAKGPENWGALDPAYQTCSDGVQQSPIDLAGNIRAQLPAINVNYVSGPLRIVNTGHTVQINSPEGSTLTLEGKTYTLTHFNFHAPSEHRVNGIAFDMEIHFVHKAEDGSQAVVALMVRQGGTNKGLTGIVDNLPAGVDQETEVAGVNFWPASLLPRERTHYRYFGSLTTPPCTENVTWLVMKTPVQASAAQINAFKQAFPANARPVQPRNRRFLLGTL